MMARWEKGAYKSYVEGFKRSQMGSGGMRFSQMALSMRERIDLT